MTEKKLETTRPIYVIKMLIYTQIITIKVSAKNVHRQNDTDKDDGKSDYIFDIEIFISSTDAKKKFRNFPIFKFFFDIKIRIIEENEQYLSEKRIISEKNESMCHQTRIVYLSPGSVQKIKETNDCCVKNRIVCTFRVHQQRKKKQYRYIESRAKMNMKRYSGK